MLIDVARPELGRPSFIRHNGVTNGRELVKSSVRIAGIDLDDAEAAFLYSGLGVLAGATSYQPQLLRGKEKRDPHTTLPAKSCGSFWISRSSASKPSMMLPCSHISSGSVLTDSDARVG